MCCGHENAYEHSSIRRNGGALVAGWCAVRCVVCMLERRVERTSWPCRRSPSGLVANVTPHCAHILHAVYSKSKRKRIKHALAQTRHGRKNCRATNREQAQWDRRGARAICFWNAKQLNIKRVSNSGESMCNRAVCVCLCLSVCLAVGAARAEGATTRNTYRERRRQSV